MPLICKSCGEQKSEKDFYSGITAHCRECWKARVRANRLAKVEQYRAYDRRRANLPERVASRAAYQHTDVGRARGNAAKKAYMERHEQKRAAHKTFRAAVQSGRIVPQPCVVCESTQAQGHHYDYSRPLDVVWLCTHHHSAFHKIEREINRKKEQVA